MAKKSKSKTETRNPLRLSNFVVLGLAWNGSAAKTLPERIQRHRHRQRIQTDDLGKRPQKRPENKSSNANPCTVALRLRGGSDRDLVDMILQGSATHSYNLSPPHGNILRKDHFLSTRDSLAEENDFDEDCKFVDIPKEFQVWSSDELLTAPETCLDPIKDGRDRRHFRRYRQMPQLAISLPHDPMTATDFRSLSRITDITSSITHEGQSRRPKMSVLTQNADQTLSNKFLKTGTTIAGIAGPDFVVLGADTRATANRLVADNAANKIHRLATNIYACGAGTSADLTHVTRLAHYSFQLQQLSHAPISDGLSSAIGNDSILDLQNESNPKKLILSVRRVCQFLQDYLFENNGSCQANLIVGGVYQGQAILRAIHPHGSMDSLAYAALGSGGLAAMAVLESRYRPNLTLEEATEIVKAAIVAGIENDLGSGSQVDLCIIPSNGISMHTRAAVPEEQLPQMSKVERREDESLQSGPNGFGNVPFSIKSRKHIDFDVPSVHGEIEWDRYLGL